MFVWMKRAAREWEDRLRYSKTVRDLVCRLRLLRLGRPGDENQELAKHVVKLCDAVRLASDENLKAKVRARIHDVVAQMHPTKVEWTEFHPPLNDRWVFKAEIIKPFLGPSERGVIFISFEDQWIRLLAMRDLEKFAEQYDMVLAPSWSPPDHLYTYALPAVYSGNLFVLISNRCDLEEFPKVAPKLTVVPLFASNWVNPTPFNPMPRDKRDIDLLMIANFAEFKRHFCLFRALRDMPAHLRVVLIGQNSGHRTEEHLREEARWYGVEDRFELLVNVSHQSVVEHLCRAKTSAVLSRREGSCVVIAESFFADTPAALLQNAHVGSREFINDQTGRLLDERHLARDLTDFIAHFDEYHPREWADKNISCFESSRRLNDVLKSYALNAGQAWTRDVAQLQWAPDPMLVEPEKHSWREAERRRIYEQFGIKIGPGEIEKTDTE